MSQSYRCGRFTSALSIGLLAFSWACGSGTPDVGGEAAAGRISEFGRYEGHSEERFSEWVRSSQYVTTSDGTRLAVDVVRPAVDGVATDEPLPVVWTHSRYHRAFTDPETGQVLSIVDVSPDLQLLVHHGYVVAAVGVRGSGASYGRYTGIFSPEETRDAYDIIEWLATQSWSDGNVGMYGGSYLGITQYRAAGEGHPALKAIFPNVAAFDLHEITHSGGIYRDDFIEHWGKLTRDLDVNVAAPVVDGDVEGVQRAEAVAEHQGNWDVIDELAAARYRDHDTPSYASKRNSPSQQLLAINSGFVPAYHWGGWYDTFIKDTLRWYVNYSAPQKVGIGPWSHGASSWGDDNDATRREERIALRSIEQLRWFDHWLKGIENGIMNEHPIHYVQMDSPGTGTWHSTNGWPHPQETRVRYFFAGGASGSVDSVNDGVLATELAEEGADRYQTDYTTTTGTMSRWDNAVGGTDRMAYPDMVANDRKSLTYTTEPLAGDLLVAGHPIVTLWASSSASDGHFHVLLEEVDEAGASTYVTEGLLRASHRTHLEPPWNNLGLPWQRSNRDDPVPLTPGEPTQLRFDLHPTANVFDAGHRIRVVVMTADLDNTEELASADGATIEILRGAEHGSSIELPIVPDEAAVTAGGL